MLKTGRDFRRCCILLFSRKEKGKYTVTLIDVCSSWPAFSIISKEIRGGEFYLEKRGSRKIFSGPRHLGSVYDKTRSLVFSWFVFTFLSLETFLPKSLG